MHQDPQLHHDAQFEAARADLVRSGLHASAASISWTLLASAVSVAFGLSAGSVVLVASGAVGLCDAAGSVSLVAHFRHALRHQAVSDRHERVAHRVVLTGLFTVGTATALASALRLAGGATQVHEPVGGIAVSAASIAVLACLASWKRRVAAAIGSRALHADGWLSIAGCLVASVTVVGTVVSDVWGLSWVDPAAALGIGLAVLGGTVASIVDARRVFRFRP